ncbi:MAG TPA: TIM barrel protein [Tepidisphaeraceae bacterium]|nr:TIM barrel protein [Tepidisphaeraceae bacterium]
MRFALPTAAAPDWDFATAAARAKELGYDGVDVRGYLDEPSPTAHNVFLTNPAKVREGFDTAGIPVACLSTGVSMGRTREEQEAGANRVRRCVDVAEVLGANVVRIRDRLVARGVGHLAAAAEFGRWIAPLADYATGRGVTIAVENALSFRTAREMWTALDNAHHPAVGAAWNPACAAAVGETPAVSVPTLNGKIVYALASDATLAGTPSPARPAAMGFADLGQGAARVRDFVIRLMGIGYRGWACPDPAGAIAGTPEQYLSAAIAALRGWTTPPAPPKVVRPVHPPAKVAAK